MKSAKELIEEFDKIENSFKIQTQINADMPTVINASKSEAMNNACGIELTKEIVEDLVDKYPKILKPLIKFDDIQARVSWLVNYVDKMNKDDLMGLKISGISTIEYRLNGVDYNKEITLAVGDTKQDSSELLPEDKLEHGLYHMRYGKHWSKSKEALFQIPHHLINGTVKEGKDAFKYEIYFRKDNCIYVVGVPSPMGDATVLITCQKRETSKKLKSKKY